jgi:hypothetical protein
MEVEDTSIHLDVVEPETVLVEQAKVWGVSV